MSASPRIVGRYALHDVIARGGMATVHLGRLQGEAGFTRTVAIKRLHEQFATDPTFRTMMIDEARIASRIHHPNVVSVLDVIALDNELYIVMEYVKGEALSRLMAGAYRRGEPVPVGIAVAIMAGALRGLHAAHEATSESGEPLRLVHRDVSPQNIMVGVDGVARVVDFGVAKAAGRMQTTRDGAVKGKLSYMSPEQAQGTVTKASDIYAASIVLWELLAGRRLFDGTTEAEIFGKVLSGSLDPPSKYVPGLPKEIDRLVLKGLDPDPPKRFASAREMAALLEKAAPPASATDVGDWVEALAATALSARADLVKSMETPSFVTETALMPRPPSVPPGATPATNAPVEVPRSSSRRRSTLLLLALLLLVGAGGYGASRFARRPVIAEPTPAPSDQPPPPPPSSVAAAALEPPPSPSSSASAAPLRTSPTRGHDPCNPPWTVDSAGFRHFKRGCFTK